MARKFATAALCLGYLHSSSSFALGLGELTLESFLNEPLRARVELLDTDGLHPDQIKVRLATRDDFNRLGVERAYFLTRISFEVQTDGSNRAQIVLKSDDPVLEPYLDFIVEARWPSGRLLREYTVLVDPPVFKQSTTVVSASKQAASGTASQVPGESQKKAGNETVVGTGTRVRFDDSGSDQAATRSYGADADALPQPGGKYMITRNDTLWEIASRARPAGATVHQTMLDIQRLNPEAFIDGNINRIKAGYVVYLPDSSEISSEDLNRALEEVRKQNEDWRQGRSSSADSAGPTLRVSAEPEQSDGDNGGAGGTSNVELAAAEEALEVSSRELADAEARVVDLEQQLETLQQIVNLKDEQIAALQGALGEDGVSALIAAGMDQASVAAGDEALLAADAGPEPSLEAVDEAGAETSGADVADSTETAEVDAAAADAAEETADTAASTVVPAGVVKSTPVQPVAAEQPGLLSGRWQYVGGALVVLGGIVWLLRRRKHGETDPQERVDPDLFADIELEEPALADADDAVAEDAEALDEELQVDLDEHVAAAAEADEPEKAKAAPAEEGGDVLAEADIYVAYGRTSQAIELLREALDREPHNHDYRLKLLGLLAESGDSEGAQAEFSRLQKIAGPDVLAAANELLDRGAAAPPAPESETEEFALDLDLGELNGIGLGDHNGVNGRNGVNGVNGVNGHKDVNGSNGSELHNGSDLLNGSDTLEADFSDLEIEQHVAVTADEIDLTEDFVDDEELDDDDDELVFAAEGNEMSTKLDLARAYMDMGDEDGAKQILEEVAAEGSSDQREEADRLIQRLG